MSAGQEPVVSDVEQELMVLLRAVSQISRHMADKRRDELRQAEEANREHAQTLQAMMQEERLMAHEVMAYAHQEQFWEQASVEDVAHIYGVAERFSTTDTFAQRTLERCNAEIEKRWGTSVPSQSPPVEVGQVDSRVLEAAAPSLAGESRQWEMLLEESAQAAHQEAAARAGGDRSRQQEREEESARTQLREVIERHPDIDTVQVTSTMAQVEGSSQTVSVADFQAFDREGRLLPKESAALNQHADAIGLSHGYGAHMVGRTYQRSDFHPSRPASHPRHPGSARTTSQNKGRASRRGKKQTARSRWDSRQARSQWAATRRAEGIDPVAVHAAATGETAMSQPAARATAKGRSSGQGEGGPRPAQQRAQHSMKAHV